MNFLIAVIVVVTSMAVKDVLGTTLVIAEASGKARLAGLMDALGDVANFIFMAVGLDTIYANGFNWKSAILIGAICLTSYNTTRLTTKWLKPVVL